MVWNGRMKPQGSSTTPSAPPPSAPPSYEEAMANAGGMSRPAISSVPYPVGPPNVPMPRDNNKGSGQTTMPMPPNYSGPSEPAGQSQVQQNADPNLGLLEVRVIHHHVISLSPNPVKMSCPVCQSDIKTTTISDHQPSAHICCIALFFLGCCLCSCLPYCMNAFRSVHHFCPNCKNYIGTWKG